MGTPLVAETACLEVSVLSAAEALAAGSQSFSLGWREGRGLAQWPGAYWKS